VQQTQTVYTHTKLKFKINRMITNFALGDRVQLSPSTDRWMMGDRYGLVTKMGTKYLHILMDKSNKTILIAPSLASTVSPMRDY
jgi:ribosomal protein L21E